MVSIHAPRVGRDARILIAEVRRFLFQSTRPVWGATTPLFKFPQTDTEFQSTRPVWGATGTSSSESPDQQGFNPRAPCGARPKSGKGFASMLGFQSTRPVWGATAVRVRRILG
ncbi:hypothetical protein HMPREF9432_01921 [Selenomonas noxia F0398]|uniref:Uncharacterized protein n=1 Tax=Selenomonas noxia F0398 TaxID=702437 RepID=A0ABN0DMS9_9FIRM|nr:hypothetical protein HMPREF9432_01921 [Selenomonas noxia F0398]